MNRPLATAAAAMTAAPLGCSIKIHLPPEPLGVVMVLPENTGGPTGFFDADEVMWAYQFSEAHTQKVDYLQKSTDEATEAGDKELASSIATQTMLLDSGTLGPAFGVNTRYHILFEIEDSLRAIAEHHELGAIVLFSDNHEIQPDNEGPGFFDITDELVASIKQSDG